ncbi:peptidylprolyl isomerase SurA [Candidatus Profftia sp. (ex Adelges kitamiensis)]|uniref:peptidylprolyl isomerase SurA n=1 Tax=Candidatus Profftia sp. (ex Adelges kitamiensis) TaxID=2864218 RepID=UPI001CE30ABA|nr:peptidylprolyl isomerase SurA [Candidatus Profftia sp. (ex Adelges kitamiensis)]
MKIWKIIILITTLYIGNVYADYKVVDRISAIVNNSPILESEVNNLVQFMKLYEYKSSQKLYEDTTLYKKALEHLIMDHIQLQIAKKIGININNNDINKAITRITKQNNISVNQIHKILSNYGIKYKSYREQIKKELLIFEVHNNIISHRIIIYPKEVEDLAKQISMQNSENTEFKLSEIIILYPLSQQNFYNVEKKASILLNKLKIGLDFNTIEMNYLKEHKFIKFYQIDWSRIQELPSIFSSSLQTAKKDDIIGPIHSDIGLHILKVDNIRGSHKKLYVTEFNIRHILLRPSPLITNKQAYIKLQSVAQHIKNKIITFDKAARDLSQDTISAQKGGHLGWISANIYDSAFYNTLIKLKKGEISEPIHSSLFGWHLIQLLDTRRVDYTKDAEKNKAYRILFDRKFNEEMQTWMQEKRASAYIKILHEKSL